MVGLVSVSEWTLSFMLDGTKTLLGEDLIRAIIAEKHDNPMAVF